MRSSSETHIFTPVQMSSHPATGDDGAPGPLDPAGVAAATEARVSRDEAEQLAEGFKLLGDPNRVRILFALREAGELCVSDLALVAEVPETTASHALRLLRTAGIVRNRRDGRMIHYRLDDDHVRLLLELSREHLAHRPATGHDAEGPR